MASDRRADLGEILGTLARGKLAERIGVPEPDWRFWERRNLNMHRVVGLWSRRGALTDAAELEAGARSAVGRQFRAAWWRGLGFGVAVEVDELSVDPEALAKAVDGRENPKGTWQWVVAVSRSNRAIAVHTWIEGYLSPLFRAALVALDEGGTQITLVHKQKDGLMKLLTAFRPRLFPDFRGPG
jgi:hypothetical protein